MIISDIRIQTIKHLKKKHKCDICGKEAIVKVTDKTTFTNSKHILKDTYYYCDDCIMKELKEFVDEILFYEAKA